MSEHCAARYNGVHCWHDGVFGTGWIPVGETRCCACEVEIDDADDD